MTWRNMQLKDLCAVFTDGDWIETKDQSSDGVRLVQTGNVKVGCFADRGGNARHVSEETFKRLNCTEVKKGDILVSRLPEPVGRACIVPNLAEKLITAVDCTIVRTTTDVLPVYLNYYMQSPQYFSSVKDKVTGATRQRISRKNLGEINIFLPPLAKQQRIVAKLDAAFVEIARAIEVEQSQLQLLNKVREANLTEKFQALGDECRFLNLSDACTDFSRGKSKHRPRNDEKLYASIIPFVQTGDISNAPKYLSTYSKMYSELGVQQSKRWNKGTVCITIAANIAELAILDIDACFPDSVIGAFANSEITSSEYLFYLLNFFQKKIKGKSKGSAQQNINLATFSDEVFPFPALREQHKIVSEISELETGMEEIIACKSKKIDALEALKCAILTQELEPREAA